MTPFGDSFLPWQIFCAGPQRVLMRKVVFGCSSRRKKYPNQEKYLAVFYYIGHIISDVCTARGIPVPGFCLTQFFTAGGRDDSLAKIAERMYLDGYDLRHLVSTAVPVAIKNLLIDAYLSLTRTPDELFLPVAEQERQKLNAKLKREKMLFISDIVGSSGNAVKFLLPPNCGNPCALNLSQWFELIRRSCSMAKEACGIVRPRL